MAFQYVDRKLRDLSTEKRKYHAKVINPHMMDRIFDMRDYFENVAWTETAFFIYLDISSLFIFGLQPGECEPFLYDFDVDLPTFEEWREGIKIRMVPVDMGDQWSRFTWDFFRQKVPPVLDYDIFTRENISPAFAPPVREQEKRKMRVGFTKYGEGYLDPPVIRDFLRSSFYEVFKKRPDYTRMRVIFSSIARGLDISEGIAEAVYNRIVMLNEVFHENFNLGFNVLGVSKLTPRGGEKATVATVNWRGEIMDVEYTKLAEPHVGLILGVSCLGTNLMPPRVRLYKPAGGSPQSETTPKFTWFMDWKTRKMITRFLATYSAFSQYQRADEVVDPHKSERVVQYHELQMIRYAIDSFVESLLRGRGLNVFIINQYKRALNQLIGYRKKRHKWGYVAYKAMTEEEFKGWWIDHWESQGLNRTILNELYERCKRWLIPLRLHVKRLGEGLGERRRRLVEWRA